MPRITKPISTNASALQMRDALRALPEVENVRVTVIEDDADDSDHSWLITFHGSQQVGNVPELLVVNNSLAYDAQVNVSTIVNGSETSVGHVAVEVSMNAQDFTTDGTTFEYQDEVKVYRLKPSHGPIYGKTEVFLYGENFKNSSGLYCHFGTGRGSSVAASAYISSTLIKCVAPPVLYARSVRVEVSHNGKQAASNTSTFGAWYSYDLPVSINSIYPKIAPSKGNASIRVVGSNFLPTDEMKCKFGSEIVQAVWLNAAEIVCRSPAHVTGTFPLEITANDQDYTSQRLPFVFYEEAVIERITPVSGPAVTAGTEIHVYGENFVNASTLTCRFADTTVPATFLSPREMVCYTPPCQSSYTGGDCNMVWQPLSSHQHREIDPSTGSRKLFPVAHYYPLFLSKIVPMEISINAQDFTDSGIRFLYQADARVLSLNPTPAEGFDTGTTPLFVQGEYFVNSTHLKCRIGDLTVKATFVTSRLVFCSTPTHPTREPEHGQHRHGQIRRPNMDHADSGRTREAASFGKAGHVYVEVSNNGVDFTSSFSVFKCLRLVDELNMTVSDSVFDYSSTNYALRRPIPCPAGTYCHPGTAVKAGLMKNFSTPQPCFESMYCPVGSYDPKGVGKCPPGHYCPFGVKVACPAGTYCPKSGHWDPQPCKPGYFNSMVGQLECTKCPAGYICPGFGRVDPAICPPGFICSKTTLSAPNVRCPPGFFCPNGTITSDAFRNDTTLRPYPCRPGTYCMGGVGFDFVVNGDFLYAQDCTEGFYCELGSSSPMGNGLCPQGFMCPRGTAVPIPTPPGTFASLLGTVAPAACLPGYYAPTIETVECYPCPPGTQCENDRTSVATICPPGTFRSRLGEITGESGFGTGVICQGCPQGTWSKNWELRDAGECIRCPPGTVCPIDGMTRPCTQEDFPKPYIPTNAGETQFECIKKEFHYFGNLIGEIDDFFEVKNGVEIPKRRGPIFLSAPVGAAGQCYFNDQPDGSVIYQRFKDYHGPVYPVQTMGNFHQGYGDLKYEGYYGRGSLYIDLPVSRTYNPGRNCTSGFFRYNRTLGHDEWIIGTCEADIFCNYANKPQAQPCSEGYVCDEGTTALTAIKTLCPEGYVCDFGTTPDKSLEAPRGKLKSLCPAGYGCSAGTGEGQKYRTACPAGYFCPSGTGDMILGRMARDGLNQGLTASEINPFKPGPNGWLAKDKLLPKQLHGHDVNEHEEHCFNGINEMMGRTSEYKYDADGKPDHGLIWNDFPAPLNLAVKNNMKCARDHLWRHTARVIGRLECDCRSQVLRALEIWRLWKCTKSWRQEPPWPEGQDSFSWPPWPTGAGPKVVSDNHCQFSFDLDLPPDAGSGRYTEDIQVSGLRIRHRWLDIEDGPRSLSDTRYAHWKLSPGERPATRIYDFNGAHTGNGKPTKAGKIMWQGKVIDCKTARINKITGFSNAYDCLRALITGEFRQQNIERKVGFRSRSGKDRFDPLTWDVHYAIELVEVLGDRVPELVGLDPTTTDSLNPLQHIPMRLDMCSCEQLLKCPNGTTSSLAQSKILDCTPAASEILRRVMPVVGGHPLDQERVMNATDRTDLTGSEDRGIGQIELRTFETATFTMDFREVDLNMTYGLHYRLSAYVDCFPCPVRYQCQGAGLGCDFPSLEEQQDDYGIMCGPTDLNGDGEIEESTWNYKSPEQGCCACQPEPMPYYFEDTTGGLQGAIVSVPYDERFYGYFDSKHDIVQVSIQPLRNIKLIFAIELLNGLYYGPFEAEMTTKNAVNIFTPHRAYFSNLCSEPCKYPMSHWDSKYSEITWGGEVNPQSGDFTDTGQEFCPKAEHSKCNTAMFLSAIKKDDFGTTLAAPFNLPTATAGPFPQDVLISRNADYWVGDPLYGYEPPSTDIVENVTAPSPSALSDDEIGGGSRRRLRSARVLASDADDTTGSSAVTESSNATVDQELQPFERLQRFSPRDPVARRQVDVTWWNKADPQEDGSQGIDW
eukprot:g5202.t1